MMKFMQFVYFAVQIAQSLAKASNIVSKNYLHNFIFLQQKILYLFLQKLHRVVIRFDISKRDQNFLIINYFQAGDTIDYIEKLLKEIKAKRPGQKFDINAKGLAFNFDNMGYRYLCALQENVSHF